MSEQDLVGLQDGQDEVKDKSCPSNNPENRVQDNGEDEREGWKEGTLSEIANFLNGLACQKYPPKNEIDKLPVLKIKELSSGITVNSDWATTEVKPEYIVRNGDVIFAWSASLMVKIWDGQDCILNQHLFKVTSKEYPKWFYYLWCKHHLTEFISIATSHATTMGHIKRGDLDEAKVLIPSPQELAAMTVFVEPLIQKIIANNIQINTLVKLRDTLLPKLMSGEVRLSEHD
jgi:type I restriction enzyme S subunit